MEGRGHCSRPLLAACLFSLSAFGAAAAERCTPVLARFVSVQGPVEYRQGDGPWLPAEQQTVLCPGDRVRVQAHGRSALKFSNESILRLDQGSSLSLGATDADPATLLELLRGAVHVITRTPTPFRIRTPFVNANVEGTEFLVRVAPEGARVAVYEGQVVASNDSGRLAVGSGEEAVAEAGQAPGRGLAVRPRDAVEWALFFPTVFDDRVGAAPAGSPAEDARRRAVDLRREGRIAEALDAVAALPESQASAGSTVYRAGLLLQVGRVDEAAPLLDAALRLDPLNGDAHALQAIVAIVRDDKERALQLARTGVERAPASAAALIALSYAEQARFDVAAALVQARAAVDRDPGNALAWSRVSELETATGWSGPALAAAERAVALDPDLSRTQSVLGFVYLDRRDAAQARAHFERAIRLDQADPLPRLGLGLAKIRSGSLAAGREDLEIAASLDPGNSIVRSYLGKAYFEEKRDARAAAQFELARQRDPHDPTPYLYDAIRKQAESRSIEALEDLQRSIELNDRRAVYRSQLLLDQDRATRQADLAGIFTELGADREALALAAQSLAADPGNDSAHRLLAQTYALRERHDISRASELLQAQMLQPLSLNPVAQELSFTDLVTAGPGTLDLLSSHDSSHLFERDGQRLRVSGTAGNLGSHGHSVQFSALRGPLSASLGQYQYHTDGFRDNNEIRHRVHAAFVQVALTPELSAQGEIRHRRSGYGDIPFDFRRDQFEPSDGFDLERTEVRLGLTARPNPDTVVLAMVARASDRYENRFFRPALNVDLDFSARASSAELQLQRRGRGWSLVSGLGYSNVNDLARLAIDFDPSSPVSCPAPLPPIACSNATRLLRHQRSAYAYFNVEPDAATRLTVGLGRDQVDDRLNDVHRWNPKLGLVRAIGPVLTARAAYFGTTKRALITQQTLEPTQVAGFNQFFDTPVGSTSRIAAGGLDLALSGSQTVGLELGRTRTRTAGGFTGAGFEPVAVQRFVTDTALLDFNWRATRRAVVHAAVQVDDWRWDEPSLLPGGEVTYLRTTRLPVQLRFAVAPRLWATGTVTKTWQRRTLDNAAGFERSTFTVLDAALRYTLPRGLGMVSLEARNLLGARFRYQDDNFRNTEIRLSNALPVRRVFVTFSTTI